MRVASAVVGGLGALAGFAMSLMSLGFWVFLGLYADARDGSGAGIGDNSYLTLRIFTDGAAAVSYVPGA